MIEASSCVVCEGAIHKLRSALVAPFLAKRIWDRPPFCVSLVECRDCGFMFYNPRLDSAEEVRLYDGYRSPQYQTSRQSSEPWYTVKFNADLASHASYEGRRRTVRDILAKHIGGRNIRRVLDYGGDRGDLVLGLVDGAAPFVYDISGIPAVNGVTATTEPAACQADLIINSNVLEHVGFPRNLVREMKQAAPAGSLIFLEVPCEQPLGLSRMLRRTAQIAWMAAKRPDLARFIIRPASLYMMHEHINYYTERSLSTLLRSCGCEVIASGSYPSSGRAGKADMAWSLGIAPG